VASLLSWQILMTNAGLACGILTQRGVVTALLSWKVLSNARLYAGLSSELLTQ
jgi:hypothetical protein